MEDKKNNKKYLIIGLVFIFLGIAGVVYKVLPKDAIRKKTNRTNIVNTSNTTDINNTTGTDSNTNSSNSSTIFTPKENTNYLPKPSNDTIISCAKSAIRKYATYEPEIGTTKLLEEDKYGRYLVSCYAKLVNGFNAGKYDVYYIVLQEIYNKNGDWYYKTNMANGILRLGDYGDQEDLVIESIKKLNKWNEEKEEEKSEDIGDSSTTPTYNNNNKSKVSTKKDTQEDEDKGKKSKK